MHNEISFVNVKDYISQCLLRGKGLFRVMQLELGLIEYKYGDRGARYLMGDNLTFFDRVFKFRLSSFALDQQYLRVATSRVKTSAQVFSC
jgi:hypothetical protein